MSVGLEALKQLRDSGLTWPCPEWPDCADDEGPCYACAQWDGADERTQIVLAQTRGIIADLERIPELELTINRLVSGKAIHEMATALALAQQRAERMEAAIHELIDPVSRVKDVNLAPWQLKLRAALAAASEDNHG